MGSTQGTPKEPFGFDGQRLSLRFEELPSDKVFYTFLCSQIPRLHGQSLVPQLPSHLLQHIYDLTQPRMQPPGTRSKRIITRHGWANCAHDDSNRSFSMLSEAWLSKQQLRKHLFKITVVSTSSSVHPEHLVNSFVYGRYADATEPTRPYTERNGFDPRTSGCADLPFEVLNIVTPSP